MSPEPALQPIILRWEYSVLTLPRDICPYRRQKIRSLGTHGWRQAELRDGHRGPGMARCQQIQCSPCLYNPLQPPNSPHPHPSPSLLSNQRYFQPLVFRAGSQSLPVLNPPGCGQGLLTITLSKSLVSLPSLILQRYRSHGAESKSSCFPVLAQP